VISDYNGIDHIPRTGATFAQQVARGVNAGIDMFMQPKLRAVRDDADRRGQLRPGPDGRIDDAVSRILTKKFELGLFEHPFTDRRTSARSARRAPRAGPPRRRRVAGAAQEPPAACCRSAARATSTSPARNADNIGNQAGGWTLTWQGGSTNVIPGTTILDGIRQVARAATSPTARRLGADPARASASSWSARRRTPRASATSAARSGPTTRATTACRGRSRHAALGADKAAVDKVCAGGEVRA
jgi:beta-glucosidase